MRPATKLFLLVGCAVVLALETPATLAGLVSGWRGPYVLREPEVASRPVRPAEALAPARAARAGARLAGLGIFPQR